MTKLILKIASILGYIVGTLSKVWPSKLDFVWYIFCRHIVTARNQHRFKEFGSQSLLAPNITLLSPEYISIGYKTSIMRHCVLETCPNAQLQPKLIIGNNVSIGEYSHITCAYKIEVGEGLLTGRFVLITDNGHGNSSIHEADIPPITVSTFEWPDKNW